MTDPIITAAPTLATITQAAADAPVTAGAIVLAALSTIGLVVREIARVRKHRGAQRAQVEVSEAEAEAARAAAEPALLGAVRAIVEDMRAEVGRVRAEMRRALEDSDERCRQDRARDRAECDREIQQVREEMRRVSHYAADTRQRVVGADDTGVHHLRRSGSEPELRSARDELDTAPETPAAIGRMPRARREVPPPPNRNDPRRERRRKDD